MTLQELELKLKEKRKEEMWRDKDKISIFGKYLVNETIGDVIRIEKRQVNPVSHSISITRKRLTRFCVPHTRSGGFFHPCNPDLSKSNFL